MFAIHEYGPPSVLDAKWFGSTLAVRSCMLCFASPPFSKMNECVFAMWFCKFLFSLNPALQVLHWNYLYFSSKVWKIFTFIYLIPGMGVHQNEWACELWGRRVFRTIFHSHHKHISSHHSVQWHSDRHVPSLICTLFHSPHRHSPLEAMTKRLKNLDHKSK